MTFDFFTEFNKMSDEYLPKISKIHQHKTSFCKAFEDLLQMHPKELSWPELFNSRMVTFQNVIEPRCIDAYIRLTRAYNEIRSETEKKKALKKKDADNYASAKDLLAFLQGHRMDPDNSLLGLAPSQQILEKHCKRIADAFANVGGAIQPLAPADLKAESLILRIMNWSELDDSAKIAEGVRHFAYQLLTNLQIGVGDVVICRLPPPRASSSSADAAHDGSGGGSGGGDAGLTGTTNSDGDDGHGHGQQGASAAMLAAASSLSNDARQPGGGKGPAAEWAYCRVYRVLPNSVVVHNNPLESKTVGVPTSNVIPLDASLRAALGSAKKMQSLVQQPLDLLYDELRAMIAERFVEILREIDVDERLCDPAAKLSLRDFPRIRAGLQNLTNWHETRLQSTLDELEAMGTRLVKDFIARLRPEKLFSPMREQTFRSLRSPPIREFAQRHIQTAVAVADENFINFESKRKVLLNGVQKRELTEWYLNHIENSVDEWLKTVHGFDFDAIPPNYLEHPPRGGHLHHVRDNLAIIEQVKSMDNPQFSPLQFMNALRKEVYVQIDDFLDNLCIIIAEKLSRPVTFDNIREVCSGIMDGSIALDTEDPECDWIRECMKDVDYILEMKDSEEITFTKKKLQLSRVVPITGLIFSRFIRIENELMTVLDVWSHLDRVPSKPSNPDINSMHSAYGLPVRAISPPPTPTSPSPSSGDKDAGGDHEQKRGILHMIKSRVGERKSTALFNLKGTRAGDEKPRTVSTPTSPSESLTSLPLDGDDKDSHTPPAAVAVVESEPLAAATSSSSPLLVGSPDASPLLTASEPPQIAAGEEPTSIVLGRRPTLPPRASGRPQPPRGVSAARLSGAASRTQSYSAFTAAAASNAASLQRTASGPSPTLSFCDPSSAGTPPADIPVAPHAPDYDGTTPDSPVLSAPPK